MKDSNVGLARPSAGQKLPGKKTSAIVFSGLVATFLTAVSLPAWAELYFNVNALHLSEEQKAQLDLSLLAQTSGQLPGNYRVSIHVNHQPADIKMLKFVTCGDRLCPTLSVRLLKALGVKVQAISALAALPEEAEITDLASYIPQAKTEFNFERRLLNLSVPQAALDKQARGYIAPERWEEGIPMLFSSYNLSGLKTKTPQRLSGEQSISQYLNLRSGLNVGAWRLRNTSYYATISSGKASWKSLQTWLERDIRTLRSRLTIGETGSPGLVFDSFSFRGIALSSQDEMQPFSQRGYAPIVRGVALTNATVEIRQNGNLLYQTFVPPGNFVINDLYATGASGDLEVTIREENGEIRKTVQAFATPPVALRQGRVQYALAAGEYGNGYTDAEGAITQPFIQIEALYGLLNNTSVYGGAIAARDYQAGMLGVGQSLGELGALSLDMTHAETHFNNGDSSKGQSWRLRYSKRLDSTATTLSLSAWRFDTEGYLNFDEASRYYRYPALVSSGSVKKRAQLTLNQNFGWFGSVSLSAWQQAYWHDHQGTARAVTSNWSKNLDGITLNLSQSLNKSGRTGKTDSVVSASFSLPLGKWLAPGSASALTLSNRLSDSRSGGSSMATTLFGSTLEDNKFSWSIAQARAQFAGKTSDSTALTGSLQTSSATLSLGYSNYYGQNERLTWAASGAIVAHPYGVTLSQPLSEGSSYALVRAAGAKNVKIVNRNGLATNSWGYAIVPALAAYQENEIVLDGDGLDDEIDLTERVQKKVPTREALVLMDYATRSGYRVFLTLTHHGKPLPLGAVVSAGNISGIADERGQVYLTGVPEKVDLQVALPGNRQCKVPFQPRDGVKRSGIIIAELECKD
ncbi:fimbria/pilus outer membrane usher protein [Kalamiella sp. sgz302252]|uniref:fimbria/pilus outer membrane usher protein n=1 Tax=Pantoea sp. sgz302252 TaxID=3341827 RepID=UPI0036D3E4AB